MTRSWLVCLALVCSATAAAPAQTGRATMARADSAWAKGDRKRARVLYAEVLALDSTASRAVFRLAQLDDSEERALAFYRRYIVLEPDDPWGHMAEGDLLARMGHVEEALIAYEGAHAIAPGERDVAIGRARLLERAGRANQAVDEFAAWTTAHPDDAEAWDLLGRAHMRAGRPRAAAQAFERADRLGVRGAASRRGAAREAAAPAITPEAVSLGDSDGNRTTRFGGSIDIMATDGLRLGIGARHHAVQSDVDAVRGRDVEARLTATPTSLVRLHASVGVIGFDGLTESAPAPVQGPGQSPAQGPPQSPPTSAPQLPPGQSGRWNAVVASARVRLRAPAAGPSFDLRLERAPVGFNPQLIGNHVERSEAKATLEVPLAALRLRGTSRFGRLTAAGEGANGRTSLEGALLLPLGSWQPSLQYRRTGFQRASLAGYFAPRLAETVEVGAYVEPEDAGLLTLSADAGAGMQRVTPHGSITGSWSRVWRAWGQAALALGPGRSWFVEVEAYDAPFALEGAATAGPWRFLSLSSGLRWVIR